MPLINLTKKTWLATKVRKADNILTRMIGLLKRKKLGPEEALWLVPGKGIHTIGMKFAIDVIFLDRDKKVVSVVADLVPYRSTGIVFKAHSCVELPAGTIKKSHTEIGDQLDVSLVAPSGMDDLKESRLNQIA